MLETSPHAVNKPYEPAPKRGRRGRMTPDLERQIVAMYTEQQFSVARIRATLQRSGTPYTAERLNQILRRNDIPTRTPRANYSEAIQAEAVAMYCVGHSLTSVARWVGEQVSRCVNTSTVSGWLDREGVWGIEPADPMIATSEECDRRETIRSRQERERSSAPWAVTTIERAAIDREAAAIIEQQHPERIAALHRAEAALRRFPSLRLYFDHLRDIMRLRHADGLSNRAIMRRMGLTRWKFDADTSHPFSKALEAVVWSHRLGSDAHSVATIKTLLRHDVTVPMLLRLYGDAVQEKIITQTARKLGYA